MGGSARILSGLLVTEVMLSIGIARGRPTRLASDRVHSTAGIRELAIIWPLQSVPACAAISPVQAERKIPLVR